MENDAALKILSDVTVFTKYAKYIPDLNRRETWAECVTRNKEMHQSKYPALSDEIEEAYKLVYDKKVLPSMRGLQFGGKPIELSPSRQYNCSYLPLDSWECFSEIMFLLLGGTGVGFSCQYHHVSKLPEIKSRSKRTRRYLIGDSIEGWADAVKVLTKSYFFGGLIPRFDFSDIRKKGTLLKTSGGRAPGPVPLKACLYHLDLILGAKAPGERLTPLEAHDMVCYIAKAVLSGGIRRAALISLFSVDDNEMATCKYGNWAETNPQRALANNSAVVLRHRIREPKFRELWKKIENSRSGDPALYLSNDKDLGINPCAEVSLSPYCFCNLTTVNLGTVACQGDLEAGARAAAFIGTLQAGYTDFHYLRDIWRETTEKYALIGVSLTGIANKEVLGLDYKAAVEVVREENKRIAGAIGIHPAARLTVVKPEGTSSCVLGTSSGVHAWKSQHYLRRMKLLKSEPIYRYLKRAIPNLVEDDLMDPENGAFLSLPIKAPFGAITEDESTFDLLQRIAQMYHCWVEPGHNSGSNTNNVSATCFVKNDEWDAVGDWMWENRGSYNGIAVFPHTGSTHKQLPFEPIDEERYESLIVHARNIDLRKVVEEEDLTALKDNLACAGGACEIV